MDMAEVMEMGMEMATAITRAVIPAAKTTTIAAGHPVIPMAAPITATAMAARFVSDGNTIREVALYAAW